MGRMAKNAVFRHLRTSAQSIPERYRGVTMVFGASLAIYHYKGTIAGWWSHSARWRNETVRYGS